MTEYKDHKGESFKRSPFEQLLKHRLFYTESFEIYRTGASGFKGDNRGLYTYGPPGCALQANLVDLWRKHFVFEEDMLEIDDVILTPEDVFKTSGHVDKFADWMCKDPKKGEFLRADHLVESVLEARLKGDRAARGVEGKVEAKDSAAKSKKLKQAKDLKVEALTDSTVKEYATILATIDNLDGPELGEIIKRCDIRNPDTNNEVEAPVPFNLMFKTSIGPSSMSSGYLRPETAQGHFVNFKKLLDYNQNTMPFASASVGKSFRNEISPRSGLLRVREFLMAEIEHFVDPEGGKKHARFDEVRDLDLRLLGRDVQLSGKTSLVTLTIGQAVSSGLVDNETLGYFMARIYSFLIKIGADPQKLRFRQHMANEMAHYAADCWDAELLTSYGWIECVSCADRSAYDLTVHAKRTGEALAVRETRHQPLSIEEWHVELNKKRIGPVFRQDAKAVQQAVTSLSQEARARLAGILTHDGAIKVEDASLPNGSVDLDNDLVDIFRRTRIDHTREYIPNVIEPSFGIGRILYSVLEHVYWHRAGDVARGVLSLPLAVAPTKVLIVPLSSHADFEPIVRNISSKLRVLGISNRVDSSSASIGKRYARNDELGTPLGITVDFDTVKNGSVTLRDRDSMKQVRASQDDIVTTLVEVLAARETVRAAFERLPEFQGQSNDE